MVTKERMKELAENSQIEKLINNSVKQDNDSKELFGIEDIEARTDITEEETSIIARLKFLCDELGLTNFEKALTHLMVLRLSKGRKSRKEYTDSLGKNHNQFMGMANGGNVGGFQNGRMG